MCGIVGQINFKNRNVCEQDMIKMTDAIRHRGPDDSGFFIKDHVGIGFRRLSIIDIDGGHQPIFNEDNSIVIVTNGEIYNYKTLKEQMILKGHSFRTKSDIEVILHLYEEYGLDFIKYLNGMFALCIYDINKNSMVLARDRVGIKPLYILQNSDAFFFASEIKGIIASDGVVKEKEDGVFEEFLFFRFLSNNRTFFKDIKSLCPGDICVIENGKVTTKRYHHNDYELLNLSDNELIERLHANLFTSVEMQMMSDAPLGTLLSGGIDSSFVTAISALKKQGIKSFTVGFEENAYDETDYAKIVSRKFGTEYHEIKVSNREFSDMLPRTIWFYDEPLNHANSVHIYLISLYAAQHVKVLITGEGADELFGGYPRYYINKLNFICDRLGAGLKNKITYALSLSKSRRVQKMVNLFKYNPDDMIIMNSAFIENPYTQEIAFNYKSITSERNKMIRQMQGRGTDDYLNQLLFFEQKTYLQSILTRADKMSMAASIEARVPFLDNEMISFANSITGQKKIRNFKAKYLLCKTALKVLPSAIVNRKKVGFGTPIEPWLRDSKGLGRYLDRILENRYITERISRESVNKLVREHREGTANHAEILWPLINYSIWDETFF